MSSAPSDPPPAERNPEHEPDALQVLKGIGPAVTDPQFRFLRAEALQVLLHRAHRGLQLCDFRNEIVMRQEGVFVDTGGVLLEGVRSRIYFKSSGETYGNQGAAIVRVLGARKIAVSTAVDIGANFGEISLFLARAFPEARVVALEPSSANLAILGLNRAVQSFPTGRLEIVREAVGARRGTVSLTKGIGTMNRVVPAAKGVETEDVSCDRLDSLFDRLAIARADFVKIDIEGGEPALADAVARLATRVGSYYIEFSKFAPLEAYLALVRALLACGFACYDEAGAAALGSAAIIEKHLRAVLAPTETAATNLWFFAPETR